MTKLEHFKAWAKRRFPLVEQVSGEVNGEIVFDALLQPAWESFQHAFTVRPTTNTRLNAAEFMKDEPETIVDRLNGIFPTADPPYKMTPLHYEAAREIERLRSEQASRGTDDELVNAVMLAQTDKLALEAEIERLRESLDGVTVTTNTLGEAVAVTITDREFRIKEVIWRKEKPAEAG